MAYVFKIKRKGVFIELKTEDKRFVGEEFKKFAHAIVEHGKNVTVETNIEGILEKTQAKPHQAGATLIKECTVVPTEKIQEPEIKIQTNKVELSKTTNDIMDNKPSSLPINFANILAAKKEEENTNVIEKITSELQKTYIQMQNLIKEKSLTSEIDYVVAAAYCISHYEGLTRFTEAQLNAKIAPFLDGTIDTSYILDAVDKNLLRVLPDFTGVSDIIEFELTDAGEEYFTNEL